MQNNNYTASIDQQDGRSSSMGHKSGKNSALGNYHQTQSQQSREFNKQNIKSKHLQGSQTINWLKKRYMNKAKDDYMLNQDSNHQESKEIMTIYQDLANNSINESNNSRKESNNSRKEQTKQRKEQHQTNQRMEQHENRKRERKKLQVMDVCGYLHKNDINISKEQLIGILNKKDQNKEEINMDEFERIMMSQTLNEKFKKCLQYQDIQQQLANKHKNSNQKEKHFNSYQLSNPSTNRLINSKPTITYIDDNITYSQNTVQQLQQNNSIINQTIQHSPQKQLNITPYHHQKQSKQNQTSNYNIQQNSTTSNHDLSLNSISSLSNINQQKQNKRTFKFQMSQQDKHSQQDNISQQNKRSQQDKNSQQDKYSQQDKLSQQDKQTEKDNKLDGQYKIPLNHDTSVKTQESNSKNKSLKNLMNSIHFQIKRQKIIDQFEKAKDNSKVKTSEKCAILENLLKLPQYQINKYKMSDSSATKNTVSLKNQVPLFLTQSGQLDQLKAIRDGDDNNYDDSSISPKQRRINIQYLQDSQTGIQNLRFNINNSNNNIGYGKLLSNKENNNMGKVNENVSDSDDCLDLNEDEEAYEMQMLVQRAKYKAKQQFKDQILKPLQVKHNKQDAQDKKTQNQLITNGNSNSNHVKRQIRTYSLLTSHSKKSKDVCKQSQETCKQNKEVQFIQNDSYIQFQDESNQNYRPNNFNKDSSNQIPYTNRNKITPIKLNHLPINGNTSTNESYNFDGITTTEEERGKFINHHHHNNSQLSSQQFSHLPQISNNNKNCTTIESKDYNNIFDSSNNFVNNSLEISNKNKNTRRRFISVFNKIHNNESNNDNNNSSNNYNNYNNNSQQKYGEDINNNFGQIKKRKEHNISVQQAINQLNKTKDIDAHTPSKTLSQNNASQTTGKKHTSLIKRQKNYSFSVFQQKQSQDIGNDNAIRQTSTIQDQYAPQIYQQQSKKYRNQEDQFFNNNNSIDNNQSYF